MAVAVAVIVILLIFLIGITVLFVKMCKKRVTKKSQKHVPARSNDTRDISDLKLGSKIAPIPAKMPKNIRMGTGFLSTSTTSSDRPDLLTDHSVGGSSSKRSAITSTGTLSSESSRTSLSQGAGSYQLAMENIIDDYRLEMVVAALQWFLLAEAKCCRGIS